MAALAEHAPCEPDAKTAFEIFRNRVGRWCVRRADGLVSGTFFERGSAIQFARLECGDAALLRLTATSPRSWKT
jgi:hypothetical protein